MSATNPQSRTLRVWQGLQRDYQCLQINSNDGTQAAGIFTSATTLLAQIWEGQNQDASAFWSVNWCLTSPTTGLPQTGYSQGQFSLSILPAYVAGLDPAGEYKILITAITGGVQSPAWEGLLKVVATPGFSSPAPPDLITYDYCLGMLGAGVTMNDAQIDALPGIISAASNLFREKCNDRHFDQRTLTEWHEVENDGQVRLWQEPVQIITRLQGAPTLALTITNTSTSVQTSQAYFTYTGYDDGYGVNAKTATGIYLNWTSYGVAFNNAGSPIMFANNPTLSALATAINAIGSGWTANVPTGYGNWASTDLTGGFVAQGCSQNYTSSVGAYFNVLADLDTGTLRPRGSMLYVGRQVGGNFLANRFGPGGYELLGDDGPGSNPLGLVKVTYVAGFSVIPSGVQNAVVQLTKYMLELLKQELLLESEQADGYQYKLSPEMVHAMPRPVLEMIGVWKYHYA